jgi:long-chain acyl-CoA synthetase
MPGVADCGAFGVPDNEFGETLVAAVQLSPGATLTVQEVQIFLRERIAHYKVPRLIAFHADLPCQPGVHVNYQETRLRIKDGLPKLKDFPNELGGSGLTVPE